MIYNLDWKDCRGIAKRASCFSGIFRQDREDFVQDVLVEMMERARRDSGGLSTREMWRAARCVRSRYWRAYKKKRGILSLNAPIRDTTIELHETIADDRAVDPDTLLDAKSRLENLPAGIVRIGKKLVEKDPLTENQRLYLSRFRNGEIEPGDYHKLRYHKLRAQGLCVKCGEESGSFSLCLSCLEKHRALQKKYREKKGVAWINTVRHHWTKQGRCPRCGGIPEPGHKRCSSCLAKNRKYLKRHRERVASLRKNK